MSTSDEDRTRATETPGLRVSLKRRDLKAKEKLCPRCLGKLTVIGELSGWLVPEEYVCEKCGYHGHVSLERIPVQSDPKTSQP